MTYLVLIIILMAFLAPFVLVLGIYIGRRGVKKDLKANKPPSLDLEVEPVRFDDREPEQEQERKGPFSHGELVQIALEKEHKISNALENVKKE